MAKTQISDIIVPEVFNPYVIQRTMELSALVQSGIIANSTEFDKLASSGGKLVNMPYFNDLDGDDEVLSDSTALTPAKITASQDVAALLIRGKSWAVNELAAQLAGADPMAAIATLVGGYWARMLQKTALATLKGIFAAASMSANVLDISSESGDAAKISASTFMDALQKLGDHQGDLTGVFMHSATKTALKKQNLITTIRPSDSAEFEVFQDRRVIVDDGCPVPSTGVYTTYAFGNGALALGNGVDSAITQTETARDALAGDDLLVNRKAYILHPRGVKFTNTSVAGATPSNTELETSTNWERVYDAKAIRIVKFVHKLA